MFNIYDELKFNCTYSYNVYVRYCVVHVVFRKLLQPQDPYLEDNLAPQETTMQDFKNRDCVENCVEILLFLLHDSYFFWNRIFVCCL